MSDVAVEYYGRKYGEDVRGAFVHTVRELGELARALEQDQRDLAVIEITEIAALMHYLASRYDIDLEENIESLYARKLAKLRGASDPSKG